jgi:hypothetical protein
MLVMFLENIRIIRLKPGINTEEKETQHISSNCGLVLWFQVQSQELFYFLNNFWQLSVRMFIAKSFKK